jgi:outer membrane protein OmpU
MNKTLIALAVAGAAVAAGANAGELYNQDGTALSIGGRAEARLSVANSDTQDDSRVRFNVKGTQELSDGLYGVGFYEAEYQANDEPTVQVDGTTPSSDSVDHRYIYAGIGSDMGLVTYGKNDAALGVITDFTDIMDYYGAAASSKLSTSDRADNMLSYAGSFDQFAVKAAYRFADRSTGTDGKFDDNNAYGYSTSVIYTVADTGVALGAGYGFQNVNNTSDATPVSKGEANQYLLTASYTVENAYFSALYTDKDFDKSGYDYKGYELAASYTMDKTQFISTYGYGETDDEKSVNSLAIEAAYKFKPNFKAYAEYNFNLLDKADAGSRAAAEDGAVLGLRYDF